MNDNIENKIKNLQEWNEERAKVKPVIDVAVDFHNKARTAAQRRDYDKAAGFYKEAIENYKDAVSLNPKYYLQDLLDRIDQVIEEYMNTIFHLKTLGGNLRSEQGINEFIKFVDNLNDEERECIDPYDIAHVFMGIGDFYYEDKDFKKAHDFYNRVIDIGCSRPFINRDAYFKLGKIFFEEGKFKESLVSFVSVLSFDRGDRQAIGYIEDCLKELHISEHKSKFLRATPNEARKLIMEVL